MAPIFGFLSRWVVGAKPLQQASASSNDGEQNTGREQNIKVEAPDVEQEIQGENDFDQNASTNFASNEEVEITFIRPKNVRTYYFSKYMAEDVNFKVAVSRLAQVRQHLEYYQLKSADVR